MTGVEFGTAAAGKAAASLVRPLQKLIRQRTWRGRLSRAAVKAVAAEHPLRRSKHLQRCLKQALAEPPIEESLRKLGQLGIEETKALLSPRLRDSLRGMFGDDWEAALHGICREIRDRYFDELGGPEAARLTHEASLFASSRVTGQHPAVLPPLVTECLHELAERGEEVVANSLKAWMTEPANRRSDVVAEFLERPETRSPLMAQASYLAWETVGHFVSAYDLGNPHEAYAIAIRRESPRRVLFQVEEALRRFISSNFADAGRILDQLPQEDTLVRVARAVVADDMPLVLSLIEQGDVCESDDPAIARFGKGVRIDALALSGHLDRAIELARVAMREYPEFATWRALCGHWLAVAAEQETADSARRERLAAEGSKLALEARDMIRRWNGPSGPPVAVAIACNMLLRDLEGVCALARQSPNGQATEQEARHPEVVSYLARSLGMLERFDELRELDTSGLSEFNRTLIEARLARHDDDPGAVGLMHRAMNLATNEMERSAALYGLASLGDSEALAADTELQKEPTDAALLASFAALERGDLEGSLTSIQPYRWASPVHAAQYAHVLVERGEIDAAVDHFVAAATRFTAPEFLHYAAALLMERSRFGDAEPLVATALTRATESSLRRILHGQGLEIANQRSGPSEMLQRAAAAAAEFPDEAQFRWAVIVALVRQHDLRRAYQYMREHSVEASDRSSSLVAAGLRAKFDRSLETVDWLLDIAESHLGDEEFIAAVLGSIFEVSQSLELSEHQAARVRALVGGFLSEFPASELFFVVEAPDIEALIDEMRATLAPGMVQRAETAEKVALGQMPFGMLHVASGRSYALMLVSGAAGALVAIPLDEDTRRQERADAMAALNGPVAIDTSGVMLWRQHLGGSPSISRCFSEILMPTELLADLRAAEHEVSASASAPGSLGVHPATGKLWISEADPELMRLTQDLIAEVLSIASGCSHVESTGLHSPDDEDAPSQLAPWDAAFRVAWHRGCALWTDDAVMRALARHYGVPAFGTYALFEALMSTSVMVDLPSHLDFKRSLINSRVADVPLTWGELEAISEEDGAGSVGFVLERPSSWSDPIETFRWFRQALSRLRDDDRATEAPYLLFSATLGACRAADKDGIPRIAGALLTAALLTGLPHELVPDLVAASRGACVTLTLGGEVDPLPAAASYLAREAIERLPEPDGALIGQYVMGIFSALDEDDQHIVSAALLDPNLD